MTSLLASAQNWQAVNAKGMEYYKEGRYQEAGQYFQDALSLSLKEYGAISREHITSLTNVGYLHQAQGAYQEAQQTFRKALAIAYHLHTTLHIDQVEAVINLANSFLPAAAYDSCEYYLLKGQELIYRAAGEKSSHYSSAVGKFFEALISMQNSLASLYDKKGQTKKAIGILEQQRQIIRQTYPETYRSQASYVTTVNNLTSYYLQTGNISSARQSALEQVSLTEKMAGQTLSYLYALNNLANIYRQQEKPDSARYCWDAALHTIGEAGPFRGSDLHLAILINLGELDFNAERYPEAIQAFTYAVDLQKQRGGLNPHLFETTLFNLAECYRWSGDFRQADAVYDTLVRRLVQEVLHNFTYLSDEEKISFYRSKLSILEAYTSFAFEASGALKLRKDANTYVSKNALKNLFDLSLMLKGLILHPGYRMKQDLIARSNDKTRGAYQQWEEMKYTYANFSRSNGADPKALAKLATEIESLEKSLRLNSPEFRKGFVMEEGSWQSVQKKLGPNEAAVEMVRLADGLLYAALIVTPHTTNGPVAAIVKSTPSMHLEKQFYHQYANSIRFQLSDTVSYGVYWEPVVKVLEQYSGTRGRIGRVYFSGDGIYHQINLNTLYDPRKMNYVLNNVELVGVTNLKDILKVDRAGLVGNTSRAVLIGRPAYASDQNNSRAQLVDLAGTEAEVDQISRYLREKRWKTKVLKGGDAQESAVRKMGSPRVFHMATHGFFIDNGEQEQSLATVLLNSGVALAGADNISAAGEDDGILTAYEMLSLNLDSTDLVVLSACETGLGEFHPGEGVYGLQRALVSAGANATIMSLWKVDDNATQQLMTSFYRYWLQDLTDKRGAFRKAQQELRKKYAAPFYWGAFVLTGK